MYYEKQINIKESEKLLKELDLKIPKGVDYTVGIFDGNNMIGTGSISGDILKGIGVKEDYQGLGIMAKIISNLLIKCSENNKKNIFIYTKYSEKKNFVHLGFKEIAQVKYRVSLLEKAEYGIEEFKINLREKYGNNKSNACIVMNCNPFTLGHLNLIEKAAKENEHLFVIILEEDLSSFPFEIRYNLVKENTKHLSNVDVIKGGKYVISSLVFPSYFTKECEHIELYARLDLNIFLNHIANALSIKKRYVGKEPYCQVTSIYNKIMKKVLPKGGVDVVEVERFNIDGIALSASKVRQLIRDNKILETKKYVPSKTFEYLVSEEAYHVIERVRKNKSRH